MQGRAADVRHSQSDVYRELFESALVGLYSARADGTLLQCNDAFLRIFGFGSRAEALAAPLDRLHVSADRRDGIQHRQRQSGRIVRARIPMRRSEGRIVHLLSSAVGVRDDSGELAEFRGVVIDVTASAQAEDALRASEQHSRAVFDDAADPILILDDERHIVDANNAAVALLGAEASLIGEQLDALVTGDRSSLEAAWRELLAFGEARREHHVTTSGRGPRILECSYRASIYEGRHLCIARDVTERRRIEERLMQSEKIESVGRLAGGIAHDFNNLLTAILGYTELLIDTQQFEGTARSDLEEILKAGRRAASLTQKLLAYGRKQLLLPQKVDLNRVVTELREMLSRLIREDIDLTLDLAEEPAPVQIDTAQLDQVIMNLVLNARDALPGGGAIRLEVARVQLTAAEIPVDQPAHGINYVRLRVSDNGVGMSDEVRAHLFEPFFTTKDVGKGTGLGLASVYGIVRQSHGFIAVESEPGRGSTITK
ncbi:MAG: PAS domain S-box protein, partial [Vicinamibacterales bacterium]